MDMEKSNRRSIRRRTNRRRTRRRIIQAGLIILSLFIINKGYNGIKKIYNERLIGKHSEEKVNKIKEVDEQKKKEIELARLPEEILNSEDIIIQDLIKMYDKNPRVLEILLNLDKYPEELLEMASLKEETVDFVADYQKHDSEAIPAISIKSDYKNGEIPHFIQWDKRWGYEKYGSNFIAISGCGPTSLAMVIVGITGNTSINPMVVADFSEKNGYLIDGVGTSWNIMTEGVEKFGIIGKEIPLGESSIINTLKKGQPIIASMKPGTFTTTGHFLVLKGVDENNKIILNDSDSIARSNELWDVDVFMEETKNLWTFTKK